MLESLVDQLLIQQQGSSISFQTGFGSLSQRECTDKTFLLFRTVRFFLALGYFEYVIAFCD